MSPHTRTLLATALLALLLATAGCTDATSAPADAPSAESLQANATAAMQDVSSATFTMDMAVETSQGELSMRADGAMDVEARKMRMEATVDAGGRSTDVTQYVVGETAYQQVGGRWQTRDVSGQNVWGQGNQLALQREMLDNSDLEIVGSDTVGGEAVWIVSIEPDEETVQQLLSRSATGVGENLELDDVTFRQFVDTDSFHVRKLEMTMDATIQGESATLELTMTFDAFDEPVDIQVPEEATG